MSTIDAVGGFDKELEMKLIDKGFQVKYVHDAIVYDEKVENAAVFQKQRTRWLSAQYHYFGVNIIPSLYGVFKGKVDFLLKTIQLSLPPRILLPFVLIVFAGLWLVIGNEYIASGYLSLFILTFMAYTIAIPVNLMNKKLLLAFLSVPKVVFSTIIAVFSLKGANKKFIHTPHSKSKTL